MNTYNLIWYVLGVLIFREYPIGACLNGTSIDPGIIAYYKKINNNEYLILGCLQSSDQQAYLAITSIQILNFRCSRRSVSSTRSLPSSSERWNSPTTIPSYGQCAPLNEPEMRLFGVEQVVNEPRKLKLHAIYERWQRRCLSILWSYTL